MRVSIKDILKDPNQRRDMMIRAIIAIQSREGINTTFEQAKQAYIKAQVK